MSGKIVPIIPPTQKVQEGKLRRFLKSAMRAKNKTKTSEWASISFFTN